MGAYSAALLANDRAGIDSVSTLLDRESIDNLQVKPPNCTAASANSCMYHQRLWQRGLSFITGNRCEKGAGEARRKKNEAPNVFAFKNKLLFDRESLPCS